MLLLIYRNLFPENILQATFQRIQTKYVALSYKRPNNSYASSASPILMKKIEYVYGTNILGNFKLESEKFVNQKENCQNRKRCIQKIYDMYALCSKRDFNPCEVHDLYALLNCGMISLHQIRLSKIRKLNSFLVKTSPDT